MNKNIGFMGIGVMGMPMAKNILRANSQLTVFDISKDRLNEIGAMGADIASSPKEVTGVSDFIITMLPDSPQVEEVLLGEKGILAGAHSGLTVMDSSTISPLKSREFHRRCKEDQVHFIDCPVGGGEKQAQEGKLLFIAGGEEDAVNRCREVFLAMGREVIYAGPPGSGSAIKIANNLIGGIRLLGLCEGFSYVEKSGARIEALHQVLKGNMMPWYEQITGHLLTGEYQPGFRLELATKDLGIAADTAKAMRTPMLLGALTSHIFYSMMLKGKGEKDWTVVKTLYEIDKK